MRHICRISVCGHFQASILKRSIYKRVSRMKVNLDLALSVSNTGYTKAALTTAMFLLSKMHDFPSHSHLSPLNKKCIWWQQPLFKLASLLWIVWPFTIFLSISQRFQGPDAKPGVQVTPDKAVHVFLRTVWLNPSTMATLPIFDNIPFGPELDFIWA